jgi:pyrimidine-specific ribonucleoside hydrolase
MKSFFISLFCFILFSTAQSHPWKPNYFVVVDTDAGLDDMRALTLLLSMPEVRVMAITVSNGANSAEVGYQKVKSLLQELNKQGILVGINKLPVNEKPFKKAMDFHWTDSLYPHLDEVPFTNVLERIQKYSSEKITFINLAGLSTLDSYLGEHPEFAIRLKQVIWTTDIRLEDSWNYSLSPEAYQRLIVKTVPLKLIAIDNEKLIYETSWLTGLDTILDSYSLFFKRSLINQDFHYAMKCYDELALVLLMDTSLFQTTSKGYLLKKSTSIEHIESQISNFLATIKNNKNQVFIKFPVDTANYISDIAPLMNKTIQKYGNEEWSICVLTNELHRHVGIYAIIGAKMGIRAREYFGAGVDEMKLISYAGNFPPISCMNDGLQVSTGATVGHGLLTVLPDVEAQPKVIFEYLGQQIEFSLKEEYRKKLEKEVKQLEIIYGINSNIYWDLVRQIALNCWFNWDRNELFEIYKGENINETEKQ